ncbi:MAG: DedA family protein, partial [Planctomycetaceae bacterium]
MLVKISISQHAGKIVTMQPSMLTCLNCNCFLWRISARKFIPMPSATEIEMFLNNHEMLAYLIIIAWTFLEGETIVIIAGIAAQDFQPNPYLVMAAAFAGSLLGDQTWFFIGRLKGKAIIAKRPFWQTKADKVYRIFERHHTLLILGFRFLYGLRNITPFVLGMSEVRTKRFIMLNVIGAAVWAATFTWGGFALGMALETW